ncbi:MAG: phosphoenolpyruvate synthase, partial [Muribaculaceae bacterium]|nr:phosphoenolpyruvate synthase [Muribaculaceae bacterium]
MNESILSKLYLRETEFQNLMQQRVFNVLLIASPYDAFMMEEDGRVEEQLYFEYVRLNLSSPPRVQQVSDYDEAFRLLAAKHFDLVIAMPGLDISETFEKAKEMKVLYSNTPIVVLTPFSREVSRRLRGEDFSGVDYVFSWLGNVNLLLAIIKLIEDKKNAENDILNVGVQMILVVEDSVHFYSSMLPTLYRFLLKQSMRFSTEALNEHEQMLRLRGRPKVLMARNYEEAKELYDKYREHILGIITDVSFNHEGKKDKSAGLQFGEYVRKHSPRMPIIVESSEEENREKVKKFKGVFVDKNSKTFPLDIGRAISDNFGFADFIIKNPATGEEIMRISNLKELQMHIFDIPAESFLYHSLRNDFSRWLYSRAMFPIASIISDHRISTLEEVPAARQLFFDLIVKYRKMKNRGVVAVYHRGRFDHYSNFARIGKGSLGGKGRGLAFIDSIIKKNPICDDFKGVTVSIPRTVVLCTDIFDEFMEQNKLYPIALSDISDEEILHQFLTASLPRRLTNDLMALVEVFDKPLAVRSSSLLEDSHYQPFAGVYSTYMIPYVNRKEKMIDMLSAAVKGVYASVFYRESKNYMTATRNVIDQEKMAVIIQEVVGARHGDYFFPSFSGVGRSLNYYPIGSEHAEDGVVEVAVGLGKYIVDGGKALRFSPKNPKRVLQTSTLDLALRDTQTQFYALEMSDLDHKPFSIDDGFNIAKKSIRDEAGTGALKYMVSTFDALNERIVDNDVGVGRRIVTFANMLSHDCFPLHEIDDFMRPKGPQAMGRPVEIEFAGMVDENGKMKGQM